MKKDKLVTVALSGGSDSVCCLHYLLHNTDYQVGAVHFNHQLRGAESDRDEDFCRELCQKWNVPLTVGRGDVAGRAKATGESIEEAARHMRYDFFASLRTTVATAHHGNDNGETVLLQLLRGTGLKGLCGIPADRDFLIRPLLGWSKAQVMDYLTAHHLDYVEDSTNQLDDGLRNQIRHHILPKMVELQPNFISKIEKTTKLLQADQDYLQTIAQETLQKASNDKGLHIPTVLSCHPAICGRVILEFLKAGGLKKPTSGHVENLLSMASGVVTLPGLTVGKYHDYWVLNPQELPPLEPITVHLPWEGVLSSGQSLRLEGEGVVTIRPRKPGDRIPVSGGHKTVKKFMIDQKIPANLRETTPIIEKDGKVIAVSRRVVDNNSKIKIITP